MEPNRVGSKCLYYNANQKNEGILRHWGINTEIINGIPVTFTVAVVENSQTKRCVFCNPEYIIFENHAC